jgi:glycerol-3-phosphate dehydrogenase (NAD(P)+)
VPLEPNSPSAPSSKASGEKNGSRDLPLAAVLGLGNWGTALGNHLAAKGFNVLGWSIEEPVVAGINAEHRNPKFLSQVRLHDSFAATTDLASALTRELVVIAIPSAAISAVFPKLSFVPEALVVSAIKGVEGKTLRTPLQCLAESGLVYSGAVVLSGPSFAKDVAVARPCGLVAASSNEKAARRVADLFSCEWMKVYTSSDTLGVELGGIVKNVIALAVGVCDGLELGDSARAGLITRGLAEMMRLAQVMGADVRTLSGLSGLGDLVMTATCDASRNRTVGLELGRGKKLPEILRALGSVAEGVETTPHVVELARRHNVEMPITHNVARLLAGEVNAPELVRLLMTRPLRPELG